MLQDTHSALKTMPSVEHLRQFVSDTLVAAVEEILTVFFYKAMSQYEARGHRKLPDHVREQDLKLETKAMTWHVQPHWRPNDKRGRLSKCGGHVQGGGGGGGQPPGSKL